MHRTKNRRLSIISLAMGYFILACFITLIISTREKENPSVEITVEEGNSSEDLPALVSAEVIDIDGDPLEVKKLDLPVVYANPLVIEDVYDDVRYVDRDRIVGNEVLSDRRISNEGGFINDALNIHHGSSRNSVHDIRDGSSIHSGHDPGVRVDRDYDAGLLDRRLAQDDELLVITEDEDLITRNDLDSLDIGLDAGGNNNIDATRFELDERGGSDSDLGDVEDFEKDGAGAGKGTLPGVGEGAQVYAYSFPSQGVGAGIGSAGVGAAAGYAGIGAGIGQAVLNGAAVATLGGIGTASISTSNLDPTPENDQDGDGIPALTERELGTDPTKADTDGDGVMDGTELAAYSNPLNSSSTPSSPGSAPLAKLGGVGGLSNGAGAGAAAGLVTGQVKVGLGMGLNPGAGSGSGEGIGGQGKVYNIDHLPPNGSLHIMMHVDGSGSILNTRKQLGVMKDTLLKKALLPYYNNDESLYNKRVTIVNGNGERTLQFFKIAAEKDNVLAVVFQDEAQPDYHLPTFNKIPQDHYKKDLHNLKSELNSHNGLYRGIMFQVDRGKTFAKSFKEFVESSWNGTGYLKEENLKKYHLDDNLFHVKNKDGIVFSDEYHAKAEGSAEYYLDLILNAANKVGIDLNIYGAGLHDGISPENKK